MTWRYLRGYIIPLFMSDKILYLTIYG
jgi:hypothetical protein